MAGTGKSTIARTIARRYFDQKCLGASFFFSRGGGERSHAGRFFTTIAVQLVKRSPVLKGYICEAVAEHDGIADQALRDQWKHLILQPLSMVQPNSLQSPLILVFDALDECNNDKDIREILQLFVEAKTLQNVQLRVFLTSRPETPIRLGFRDMDEILHQDLVLENVSRDIIDHDILIFFEEKFRAIRNASDLLQPDWPGKEVIDLLVVKAHGLFIYAATVCRFIEDGGEQWPPDDLLRVVLPDYYEPDSSSDMKPTQDSLTEELDIMYTHILKHSLRNVHNERTKLQLAGIFRQVVGAILNLFDPLPAVAIARLLNLHDGIVQARLQNLRSVLIVPDDEQPIRILHPSFRDFLLDEQRCRDRKFLVDKERAHRALVDSCLQVMSIKLKRDMCDLQTPGAPVGMVQSTRVEQCLPAELQYACLYWVQHLQESNGYLSDNDRVHTFLQQHLLHWLEVLSLIGKMSESVRMVTTLQSMVKVSDFQSLLLQI
jgi:NACHT domain